MSASLRVCGAAFRWPSARLAPHNPQMDFAHRWLLLAGILLLASVLASRLTSRIGAPMLLVFLALGMLVGEEGLGGIAFGERRGGIAFDDIRTAYLVEIGRASCRERV